MAVLVMVDAGSVTVVVDPVTVWVSVTVEVVPGPVAVLVVVDVVVVVAGSVMAVVTV